MPLFIKTRHLLLGGLIAASLLLSACQQPVSTSVSPTPESAIRPQSVTSTRETTTANTPDPTLSSGSVDTKTQPAYTSMTLEREAGRESICGVYTLRPTPSENDGLPTIQVSKNGVVLSSIDDSGMSTYQAYCDGEKPYLHRSVWGGLKSVSELIDWDFADQKRVSTCTLTYDESSSIEAPVSMMFSQEINNTLTQKEIRDDKKCQEVLEFAKSPTT